jgi:hypothetical protein
LSTRNTKLVPVKTGIKNSNSQNKAAGARVAPTGSRQVLSGIVALVYQSHSRFSTGGNPANRYFSNTKRLDKPIFFPVLCGDYRIMFGPGK